MPTRPPNALFSSLSRWVSDNKEPAPDVYGARSIGEILDLAEKIGLIKKETGGFFSKLFN